MRIELICFAGMKDFFPSKSNLDLEREKTISDLRVFLETNRPEASSLIQVSRFAINQSIVKDDEKLFEGASVAVLPPSSGG